MKEKIRPSTVPSIYEIEKRLSEIGLTFDQYVLLVRDEMKGNPPRRDIAATLRAAKVIERQLMREEE